jgi:hypothetical protein
MNIVDVRNIGDVRNVGHVPDVGNVHFAEILTAIVIPGKERFSRAQGEPTHEVNTDPNREAGPS